MENKLSTLQMTNLSRFMCFSQNAQHLIFLYYSNNWSCETISCMLKRFLPIFFNFIIICRKFVEVTLIAVNLTGKWCVFYSRWKKIVMRNLKCLIKSHNHIAQTNRDICWIQIKVNWRVMIAYTTKYYSREKMITNDNNRDVQLNHFNELDWCYYHTESLFTIRIS